MKRVDISVWFQVVSSISFTVGDVNEPPYDLHLTSSNAPIQFPDDKPKVKENAKGRQKGYPIDHMMDELIDLIDLFDSLCVCLLVCLGIYFLLQNSLFTWRCHQYQWRASNFGLYHALMAIKQWRFFNVPYLLWQRKSVYNGHLQRPVTLTPFAKSLAVELSLPVFTTIAALWLIN